MEADSKPKRPTKTATKKAVLAYVEAINAHDVEAAVAAWAVGGVEHLHGQRDIVAPDGTRQFLDELFGAFPDARFTIDRLTVDADRATLQMTLRGTFAGPGAWAGFEPNGARVEVPLVDVILVAEDGLILQLDAYVDGMTIGRQLGVLPPQDSATEQRLAKVANVRTRAAEKLVGTDFGQIAEGVWRLQGQPARCNVYFVADGDGVLMFDAGARTMTRAVASAAAQLGGLTRIVLGHGHTDHRGTAPAFDVPILCHPDEVVDAEGSGGWRYWEPGLKSLGFPHARLQLLLHEKAWDGGPVKISGTVEEGDDVAGFRVVHIPGHAPGQIALFRESDRLALSSDCFYTLNIWGRDCEPALPLHPYNFDTEQARASIRKLAALEPAAVWPGHALPVTGGDVRQRLERAAGA